MKRSASNTLIPSSSPLNSPFSSSNSSLNSSLTSTSLNSAPDLPPCSSSSGSTTSSPCFPGSPRTPQSPYKRPRSRFASPINEPTEPIFLQRSPLTPQQAVRDYYGNGFQEVKKLGEGSYSSVTKVLSNLDKKYYAIKKTNRPFHGKKDRAKKINEIEVLKKIGQHPHCLVLHEAWEEDGFLYMRTELCEQGSLKQILDEKQSREELFDEGEIWKIIYQIADGLSHIHRHGLVHLDIKSENIFLDDTGCLKIGDFGLAFERLEDIKDDSEGDRIYLAPEILQGVYAKEADIFSFGMVLLEVCTMQSLPIEGDEWHKVRSGDFSSFNLSSLSSNLQQLLHRMLSPNPSERPSAIDILALENCLKVKGEENGQNAIFPSKLLVVTNFFKSLFPVWKASPRQDRPGAIQNNFSSEEESGSELDEEANQSKIPKSGSSTPRRIRLDFDTIHVHVEEEDLSSSAPVLANSSDSESEPSEKDQEEEDFIIGDRAFSNELRKTLF